MKTEMTISSKAASEVIKLIQEYLIQGGDGFDELLLEEAYGGWEQACGAPFDTYEVTQ